MKMLVYLMLFHGALGMSPEADVIVANSMWTYNVVFACCITWLVVLFTIGFYQLFVLLWMFVRFSEKEYTSGKAFASGKFAEFEGSIKLYMAANTIINGLGSVSAFCGLFKSNTVSLNPLSCAPQGFRKDANRAGMFMTGLLSLAILVLAPIMGAKKVLSYLEPIISCLKKLPYATWLCSWMSSWWEGEVNFDDLPQDDFQFRKHSENMDGQDEANDALRELRRMKENMSEGRTDDEIFETD